MLAPNSWPCSSYDFLWSGLFQMPLISTIKAFHLSHTTGCSYCQLIENNTKQRKTKQGNRLENYDKVIILCLRRTKCVLGRPEAQGLDGSKIASRAWLKDGKMGYDCVLYVREPLNSWVSVHLPWMVLDWHLWWVETWQKAETHTRGGRKTNGSRSNTVAFIAFFKDQTKNDLKFKSWFFILAIWNKIEKT